MKKVFYAVMLLLGLSILGSCSKGGGSALVGKWWPEHNEDEMYLELTREGKMVMYEIDYYYDDEEPSFEDGTLYTPKDYSWEAVAIGDYTINGNQITFLAVGLGPNSTFTFKKDGNDKFIISGGGEVINTFYRIKNFKTK